MNPYIASHRSRLPENRQSTLLDLPALLAECDEWQDLLALLTDLMFVEAKSFFGHSRTLLADYELAVHTSGPSDADRQTLLEWQQFARQEINALEQFGPRLSQVVFQQAYNHTRDGKVAGAAEALLSKGDGPNGPWLERVNRPGGFRRSDLLLTLEGHTAAVTGVIALDADRAVSASNDGSLRVWDLATGACQNVLRGHEGKVQHLAAGDRGQFFSAALDGTVRVWDASTFASRAINAIPKEHSPIGMTAVPGGRVCSWIAGSREEKVVHVWDAASGERLCMHESPERRIDFVSVLDGDMAVGATSDGMAWLWSLRDGGVLESLDVRPGRITCLSCVGSRFVALGSANGALWVHDRTSGAAWSLPNKGGAVRCMAPVNDGSVIAGTADGSLHLWDLESGELTMQFEGHSAEVTKVVAADKTVVSVAKDSALRIWDLKTGECLVSSSGSGFESLALVPGGRALASSFHTLQVWDTAPGSSEAADEQHNDGVMRMVRTRDGRLISGGRDGDIRVWDLDAGNCLATLRGHGNWKGNRILALLVTPDGRLVSSGEDDQVFVWDLKRYQQIEALTGHPATVLHLGWSAQGEIIGKCVFDYCGWDGQTLEFLGQAPIAPEDPGAFEEAFDANQVKTNVGEPALKKDDGAFSGPLLWTVPLDSDLAGYLPPDPAPDVVYPPRLEVIQTDLSSQRIWGFDEAGRFYVLQLRRAAPRAHAACARCGTRDCRPFVQVRNASVIGLGCLKKALDASTSALPTTEHENGSTCAYCQRLFSGPHVDTGFGPMCDQCKRSAVELMAADRPAAGPNATHGIEPRSRPAWSRPDGEEMAPRMGKSIRDKARCPNCRQVWTWDDMYSCTVGCGGFACIACWRKSGSREACPSCGEYANTCYTIANGAEFEDA